MAAPVVYRASDTGAPTLNGLAGSLITVLDACLVNGYGSKAAAGWTKPFSSGNQAVYRMGAGAQLYLDVDDRGASGVLTGASGLEAAVRGYETMSAVSTGTGAFPTTGQVAANTANWRKSNVADASPRTWMVVADDRTFYLLVWSADAAQGWMLHAFGDLYSPLTGDAYRVAISVRTSVNASGTGGCLLNTVASSLLAAATGLYSPRVLAATGTSINVGPIVYTNATEGSTLWYTSYDQLMYVERVLVNQGAVAPYLRGWFRGLWMMHPTNGLDSGQLITGANELAGRTFLLLAGVDHTLALSIAIETTAWEASS